MYRSANIRVVQNNQPLTFTVKATGQRIVILPKFVCVEQGGCTVKGVQITTQEPLPSNLQLLDETGDPITPGDDHVIPKGHNACSLRYADEHYGLFAVKLVDEGDDTLFLISAAGGVLYFHTTAAIPPELGGPGLLEFDPTSHLETCSSERFSS